MVTTPAELAAGHHHGAADGAAFAAGRAAGGAAAAAHLLPTVARHPAARHQAGAAPPALDASYDYIRAVPSLLKVAAVAACQRAAALT